MSNTTELYLEASEDVPVDFATGSIFFIGTAPRRLASPLG